MTATLAVSRMVRPGLRPRCRVRESVSRLVVRAVAGTLLILAACGSLAAQPQFPPLTGRVVDEAALLTLPDKQALTEQLDALEKKSTDQVVVVTLKSLQGYEIADYGYRLGRTWGIGQGSRKDNGVLLIVVPSQRKVRIEVGRGLEHLLTDATSRLIIENRILPAFRRGDFPAGIKAGVTDIRDVLLGDAEGVKARAKGARRPVSSPPVDWVGVAFFAFIVGSFLYQWFQAYRRARPLPAGQRRRRGLRRSAWGRDPGPTWGGSSGGWSGGGGGWSSGGGSGGGFSGGGGGFGGGGASGDW